MAKYDQDKSNPLLQEMLQTSEQNIELIRTRDPELSRTNFTRSVRSLVEIFADGQTLKNKAAEFASSFETSFFAGYIHQTGEDLGESVKLESARRALIHGHERDTNTTSLDMIMDNDKYVFASSKLLAPSGGYFSGRNNSVYEISAQTEGWAASADILELPRLVASPDDFKETEAERLYLTARNLFTIPDFKLFFSVYCATFFDTPEQAVNFFTKYSPIVNILRRDFVKDPSFKGQVADRDLEIMERMRDLFVTRKIVPPFLPEFQFKDEVVAVKLEK